MLYGVRKHINDMLAPAAQRDNPEFQAASRNLIDLKRQLDDVIETGAPGFKDYIDAYSRGAGPIEGMRFLQGLNLTNSFGDQTLGKLDQAIKQIDKQRNLPGARPADSISDDQYQRLVALRDDMRREARTQTAGKTNSGTFQDLATNSRVGAIAGNPLVATALGGIGAYTSGNPLGAMVGTGTSMALSAQQRKAQDMLNKALLDRLLNVGGKGEAALRGGK
jgi:hypothetical protein